jgi:hypothetical protein
LGPVKHSFLKALGALRREGAVVDERSIAHIAQAQRVGYVTMAAEAAATQRDALRAIGPWLAFHFVFLISAFVTVWLLMTWMPSVPTLFLSLLLLGGTVFFSILHLVSQVYS